jgi:hypothetical protein
MFREGYEMRIKTWNAGLVLALSCMLASCGGGSPGGDAAQGQTAGAIAAVEQDEDASASLPASAERKAGSGDVCAGASYPAQWEWDPRKTTPHDLPATSGTPKIEQVRNGVVIATYTSLSGVRRSKPDSSNGEDTSVGPFRRQPYTQWKSGDLFLIYPAVYSGPEMQIYVGPNIANDAAYTAGVRDVPKNITIRGVSVQGRRPVIVNPPSGANNENYGQSLIYIDGRSDAQDNLIDPASNITIENLDIVDAPTGGFLGKAAVYVNGAENFTLRNVRISGFKQHSVNGIFGTYKNIGTLLLDNVELEGNGGNGGPEHNAYINASKTDSNFTFHVRGSWSHGSFYGHALKSRAQRTVVEGSYLSGERAATGKQTEAYLLDVPDGGMLTARNNVFVKNFSGNNSNGASLTFGVESANPARAWNLNVQHNTFVALSRYYDDQHHELFPLFISTAAPGNKLVDSNVYIGYCPTGNPTKDFRGTNFATLGFGDINLAFHPLIAVPSGPANIKGTLSYAHEATSAKRKTSLSGARD